MILLNCVNPSTTSVFYLNENPSKNQENIYNTPKWIIASFIIIILLLIGYFLYTIIVFKELWIGKLSILIFFMFQMVLLPEIIKTNKILQFYDRLWLFLLGIVFVFSLYIILNNSINKNINLDKENYNTFTKFVTFLLQTNEDLILTIISIMGIMFFITCMLFVNNMKNRTLGMALSVLIINLILYIIFILLYITSFHQISEKQSIICSLIIFSMILHCIIFRILLYLKTKNL